MNQSERAKVLKEGAEAVCWYCKCGEVRFNTGGRWFHSYKVPTDGNREVHAECDAEGIWNLLERETSRADLLPDSNTPDGEKA